MKKILSLQGIRALCFLGIFLEHSGVISLGSWGVEVFFVLSGFLMTYNYYDRKIEESNLKFAFRKIKKLYPLHIIMMVFVILLCPHGLYWNSIRKSIISLAKLIFNIFLMQSWIPKSEFYFSLNSVSWYLSTATFLYFVFPRNYDTFETCKKSQMILRGGLILFLQVIVCIFMEINKFSIYNISPKVSDNLIKYISYICPLYRLGDFYMGCIIGRVFLLNNKKYNNIVWFSAMEALALIGIPLFWCIDVNQIGILGMESFRYSFLYQLNAVAIVYIFSFEIGVFSKLLRSKPVMVIANLSAYGFLIHQCVIVCVKKYCPVFITQNNYFVTLLSLCITLVLSCFYRKAQGMSPRLDKKKQI